MKNRAAKKVDAIRKEEAAKPTEEPCVRAAGVLQDESVQRLVSLTSPTVEKLALTAPASDAIATTADVVAVRGRAVQDVEQTSEVAATLAVVMARLPPSNGRTKRTKRTTLHHRRRPCST